MSFYKVVISKYYIIYILYNMVIVIKFKKTHTHTQIEQKQQTIKHQKEEVFFCDDSFLNNTVRNRVIYKRAFFIIYFFLF